LVCIGPVEVEELLRERKYIGWIPEYSSHDLVKEMVEFVCFWIIILFIYKYLLR
jgi:hypothetical protein